jgi:hypothetical protein
MKWTSWTFLAFVGSLIFLELFLADRRMNAGADRLPKIKFAPHATLEADPNLKLVSERSPHMRTER